MPRKYPQEFRDDVVRLARDPGRQESLDDLAARLGISSTSIGRWVRQAEIDEGTTVGVTSDEQAELARLRRDKRRLEQENEILRRAAAYFAKDALPK